jgi:hypothetical protein
MKHTIGKKEERRAYLVGREVRIGMPNGCRNMLSINANGPKNLPCQDGDVSKTLSHSFGFPFSRFIDAGLAVVTTEGLDSADDCQGKPLPLPS